MIRASDDSDGDDLTANVTYRMAYGEASRIVESRDRSFASGRDRVRDVRIEAQAMAHDIGDRLGVEPAANVEAVEDAPAGRRPRWRRGAARRPRRLGPGCPPVVGCSPQAGRPAGRIAPGGAGGRRSCLLDGPLPCMIAVPGPARGRAEAVPTKARGGSLMMSIVRRIGLAAVVLGSVAGAARADIVVFDFEGQAATAPPRSGALTSLTLVESGLTLILTREGGTRFDIQDNPSNPGMPASYGTRSLDPFFDQSATAFLGDFSAAVDGVSIDLGDFGADADDLVLQAFSGPGGTGSLLAQATGSLPATGPTGPPPGGVFAFTGTTLSVTAAGIGSIRFIGGSTLGLHSVFADNITVNVTAIPEASTLAMGGLVALAGLGYAWRRRRAA